MTAVPLFRPQAIAHRRHADQAGVALPAAPPPALLVWSLLATVALGVGFAGERSYARREHVTGYLAPLMGVARILPPRAGMISEVDVHDGDLIAAGASLVTLRTGTLDGSGADVDAAVLATLRAQRDRIAEQIVLAQRSAAEEGARLADHAASLAAELDTLEAAQRLQRQRTQLTRMQVDAAGSLVGGGNISRIEYQHRQDAALANQQAEIDLTRAIAEKRAEMAEDRHSAAALPDTTAGRVAALRGQAAEIETRIAETEGSRAILLRAPIAGRVSALQARTGQMADPAIPLLAIVPEGDALRAELLIPARAIGEIRSGQSVRLAYDAFPALRFGLQSGTVISVSHSLLRPAEITGPVVPSGPAYRVSVQLARQSISLGGTDWPLAPDMTVSADVIVDRHSLLGWLLAPLTDHRESTI